MGKTREELTKKRADLSRLARLYATERISSQRQYVGQFVDREACLDEHYGVYGMAAYLSLASNDSEQNDVIRSFADKCRNKLSEWVSTKPAQVSMPKERQAVAELNDVVPKICSALVALRETPHVSQILLDRLNSAPHKWGLLTNSALRNPVITANAVRDILAAGIDFWKEVRDATEVCHFLLEQASEETQEYAKQLLVLNTLAVLSPTRMDAAGLSESDQRKMEQRWISSRIRNVLGRVVEDSRLTPFVLPNPLIEDEVHGSRCRYVRYSTDLILLETLHHASSNGISFLETALGKHLALRLINSLHFELPLITIRNTCGERLSFSTASFTDCVLRTIADGSTIIDTPTASLLRRSYFGLAGAALGVLIFMTPAFRLYHIGERGRLTTLLCAALLGFVVLFLLANPITRVWSRFIRSRIAAQAVWDVRVEWKRSGRLLLYGIGIIVFGSLLLSVQRGFSWRELKEILVVDLRFAIPGVIAFGILGRLFDRASFKFFNSHE